MLPILLPLLAFSSRAFSSPLLAFSTVPLSLPSLDPNAPLSNQPVTSASCTPLLILSLDAFSYDDVAALAADHPWDTTLIESGHEVVLPEYEEADVGRWAEEWWKVCGDNEEVRVVQAGGKVYDHGDGTQIERFHKFIHQQVANFLPRLPSPQTVLITTLPTPMLVHLGALLRPSALGSNQTVSTPLIDTVVDQAGKHHHMPKMMCASAALRLALFCGALGWGIYFIVRLVRNRIRAGPSDGARAGSIGKVLDGAKEEELVALVDSKDEKEFFQWHLGSLSREYLDAFAL